MSRVMPEYPELAGGRPGRVLLQLFVDETGRVDEIAVLEAEPAGLFEAPAVRAFGAARFTPGRKRDRPVKSVVKIEVKF